MSVCLSDSELSNTFFKILVPVYVPGIPKKSSGTALLPATYFFAQLFIFFFGSLVNETFLNLKFNVFIITGSIFGSKYVKQVVLINHSWILPFFTKGMWIGVLFILQKMGKDTFCSKEGRGW